MKMYKKVMAAALAGVMTVSMSATDLQQMMTAIFSKPQMKIPNHPTMIW